MLSTIEEITETFQAVVAQVETITSLPSRWNRRVEIGTEVNVNNSPAYSAKFRLSDSSLLLHVSLLETEAAFASLVHEAFHSVSVGLTPLAFARCVGFEEAVVETATRHFGPVIGDLFNLPSNFGSRTQFDQYLSALETVRSYIGTPTTRFVVELLSTPLPDRDAAMVQWALEAHPEESNLRVFARIGYPLRNCNYSGLCRS